MGYSVELKGISYVYSPDTPFMSVALDETSVSFEEGLITGLVGHTGSGKSTLVQLINGLIKPSNGEVIVNGRNIWEKPKEIRNVRFEVGLVFQYPEYQLFEETVKKDIAFGPKNMGLSDSEIEERVIEAMKLVGLPLELAEVSPFDLSGGQKRRVAIAGVIAMRPKILILDEPAAGLDPSGRKDILEQIVKYKQSTNATIIMTSHSMEDIAKYCEKVVVMSKGKVVLSGTCDEVFSYSNLIEEIGLSVPQITKFINKLNERGYKLNSSIYTISKAKEEISKLLGGDSK